MVERFPKTLKISIKVSLESENWMEVLPVTLSGIRLCIKEDLGISSAEIIMVERFGCLEIFLIHLVQTLSLRLLYRV